MTFAELFSKYDKLIKVLAQRADSNHWEDCAQNMRLFILKYYSNYDPNNAPEDYYIKMMIFTAYRRQVFDKTKQQRFEHDFVRLIDNMDIPEDTNNYDYFVESIVRKIVKPKDKIVFYSILYNVDNSNYKQLAAHLHMDYMSFLNSLNKIKKAIRQLKSEESVL